MKPQCVSPFQLKSILQHHPCFHDFDLDELVGVIAQHARSQRLQDLIRHLHPSFKRWMSLLPAIPEPHIPPNVHTDHPVREYHFDFVRNRFFVRDRHCVGVTFATFVRIGKEEVGVVWTSTRKAYMFKYEWRSNASLGHLPGWVVFKILNRQDDPFHTWRRHLGGDALARNPQDPRNVQQMFHDFVVPFFGSHPLARHATRSRRIPWNDPVWQLVKLVSYEVVSSSDPRRVAWVPS